MTNIKKIQFSKSALMVLNTLSENVQNKILAAITKAMSLDFPNAELFSTPLKGDSSYYALPIGSDFRVVLKFENDFIHIKNIFSTEIIDYYHQTAA